MALPPVTIPRATVKVGDDEVLVRGLSRAEAVHLQSFGSDLDAAENYVLCCGAGVSLEEAAAWRAASPAAVVGEVVDRIVDLSGLGDSGKE